MALPCMFCNYANFSYTLSVYLLMLHPEPFTLEMAGPSVFIHCTSAHLTDSSCYVTTVYLLIACRQNHHMYILLSYCCVHLRTYVPSRAQLAHVFHTLCTQSKNVHCCGWSGSSQHTYIVCYLRIRRLLMYVRVHGNSLTWVSGPYERGTCVVGSK